MTPDQIFDSDEIMRANGKWGQMPMDRLHPFVNAIIAAHLQSQPKASPAKGPKSVTIGWARVCDIESLMRSDANYDTLGVDTLNCWEDEPTMCIPNNLREIRYVVGEDDDPT